MGNRNTKWHALTDQVISEAHERGLDVRKTDEFWLNDFIVKHRFYFNQFEVASLIMHTYRHPYAVLGYKPYTFYQMNFDKKPSDRLSDVRTRLIELIYLVKWKIKVSVFDKGNEIWVSWTNLPDYTVEQKEELDRQVEEAIQAFKVTLSRISPAEKRKIIVGKH